MAITKVAPQIWLQLQAEAGKRKLAERNLHDFVVQAWPTVCPDEQFIDGWHITAICLHLEAVTEGRIKQLLINVPPGTMKSLLTSVFWPAWTWITRPSKKFMFASYSDYLSMRDSVKCRDLVTSDWYQKRWPIELKDDQNAKGKWDNTKGGWRLATSVGGKGTGEHPDFKCLLKGTRVRTLESWKPIEQLKVGELVLSRDLQTGQDQWKPIISTTKSKGKASLQITLATGQTLRCTTDHQIFTRSGYTPAGQLQPGQEVACEISMRPMRSGIRQVTGTRPQSENAVLLAQVPWRIDQRSRPPEHERDIYLSMPDMPEDGHASGIRAWQESQVLLRQMPRQEAATISHKAMQPVREGLHNSASQTKAPPVLLNRLLQHEPPNESGGQQKRAIRSRGARKTIQGRVHKGQAAGSRAGSEPMRSVRSSSSGLRQGDGRSPHRLRQEQQQREQPRHALPILPRETAREQSQPGTMVYQVVRSVESIPPPEWVYDIGIADNHNFYAEGILVHNCFDDPHNTKEAESEVERQGVIEWWDGTMETRGAMKDAASIGVMQRLHASDLSGHLLEKGGWEHICLPMRYEAPTIDEQTGQLIPRMKPTSIGWTDPRQTEGELLWPKAYSADKVANLEVKLGIYHAAGQLQQRPTPRGGGKFLREWFRVLTYCPPLNRIVRYWDKAGTDESAGTQGARTAGALMGEYTDAAAGLPAMRTKYIILDVIAVRKGSAAREAMISQTAASDQARFGHVESWVEQEPGSGGKESAESTVANNPGFSFSAERVTGSKEVRADPLCSQASVGKVALLAGAWNRDLLDELEAFPVGKLKDMVDATGGAFNKLAAPGTGIRSVADLRPRPQPAKQPDEVETDIGPAERLNLSQL